jgi:hypothetical protein
MYDQVLRHLETISHEARIPPKSQLNFGEIANVVNKKSEDGWEERALSVA